MAVCFDGFTLDPETGELHKDGELVKLKPQPAKVLALLASRAGTLVTREEIQSALWPDETYVDFDLGINSCIRQIRIALADDAESPRYIQTLSRRGYRFLALETATATTRKTKTSLIVWMPWVVAGLAMILAGLAFWPSRHDEIPRLTNPVQVTSAIGLEEHPSWSSDGRTLAYHSDQSGNWDIWISQIDGGQPLNRTADHDGSDQYPSWSPDASRIAFASNRGGDGIFVMPVFNGPPKRVSRPGTLARDRPQWSSDGTKLAYEVRESDRSFVEITTLATGESRRIELPGVKLKRLYLSWSPNDRFFAYVDADEPSNDANALMILRLADETAFAITGTQTLEVAPSWSPDERALYFASNTGGTLDLWRQPLAEDARPEGSAEPVTAGLEVRSAAFSPDGTQLAYSKGRGVSNLWRVPIVSDRLATWADAEQMTFDEAFVVCADVSPEGSQLAFSSNRSGNFDAWTLSLENRELRQLTSDPGMESCPSWSPDGRELTFYSNRAGTRDVWVKNVDGGPARQLTRGENEDYFPTWHPDGGSVVFGSTKRDIGVTIWTVPTDGGSPTRLVKTPDVNSPFWSPDGEWLAFSSYGHHVTPRIWLMHRSKAEPEVLTTGHGKTRWSLDGKRLFVQREINSAGPPSPGFRRADLWVVDLETRVERQLTDLSGRTGFLGDSALATDGTYLYFSWREDASDLWVMQVATEGSD